MRFLVVGSGGLGTVFAGLLAQAGGDVTVLVKESQVPALQARDNKLCIEGLVAAEVPARVATTGRDVGDVDWLLVLVKNKDTTAALEAAAGCRPGAVLSLQNGLAKDDTLAAVFGAGAVVHGVTMMQATKLGAGHARLNTSAPTWVGETDGTLSPRIQELAQRFEAAGLPANAVEDVAAVEWWKLIGMLSTSLASSLARCDSAAVFTHPLLADVYVDIAEEVMAVARAEGVTVVDPPGTATPLAAWTNGPRDDFLAALGEMADRLLATGQKAVASMTQDVLAERRTEVEHVAGDVVRRAAARGVPVPVLDTCYRLLRGLEDGFGDEAEPVS